MYSIWLREDGDDVMSDDYLRKDIKNQGDLSYYDSLSKELNDKWDEWKACAEKYGYESRKTNKLWKKYMQLYELKQDIRMTAIGKKRGVDWEIESHLLGR